MIDGERLHITEDKRKIKDFPKPRQGGASFIRKTLYAMPMNNLNLTKGKRKYGCSQI